MEQHPTAALDGAAVFIGSDFYPCFFEISDASYSLSISRSLEFRADKKEMQAWRTQVI